MAACMSLFATTIPTSNAVFHHLTAIVGVTAQQYRADHVWYSIAAFCQTVFLKPLLLLITLPTIPSPEVVPLLYNMQMSTTS